jgi:predicted nucleic acid-binding protein
MPDKIFIDTNIVNYSLGQAPAKANLAAPLFVGSPSISTQVLFETANVASKRLALSLSLSEIRKLITSLEAICRMKIISLTIIHTALDTREQYSFSWHAVLLSLPRWKLAAIPFTPKICRTAKRLRDDCASSTRLFDPCLC